MSLFHVFFGSALLLQASGKIINKGKIDIETNILHPNIQYITIDRDGDSGNLKYNSWTPSSKEELETDANLRSFQDKTRNVTIAQTTHMDYINIERQLTYKFNWTRNSGTGDAIVETLIVCDKEFGDVFQHDRNRILDYWTVYFWDVNMRYKTLPSVNVAFRITGVVVISTPAGQPFIEEARAQDGRAEYGRILERFKHWVYEEDVSGRVAKFDIAIAITNTECEWGGGLAYRGGACGVNREERVNMGTGVFSDAGDWGSLTVGAHEIGHILGGWHDDNPEFPGGCPHHGYIMAGGNDDWRWFFSPCSNRVMGDFFRSDQASCLRRIDAHEHLPISEDFSSVSAPSMAEQCKRLLQNSKAFIEENDTGNCKSMRCVTPGEGVFYIHNRPPVDNTPCLGGGRCFRGRCRPQGSLIKNVGTGQCMRATNPFGHMAEVDLVNCPNPGTPLDRFVITDDKHGKTLATPFASEDAKENMDKCVYTGTGDVSGMSTDRCVIGQAENPWHGWDFHNVGNDEFILQHRQTKKCAKAEGSNIRTYILCDTNDRNMRWKLQ